MLFNTIFLTAFFLTWALLGSLIWLVWSIRRDTVGAIWAFPFGLLGGIGGGVILPLLDVNDGLGIGLSMVGALVGATLLTSAAYRVWDDYGLGARFAKLAQPAFAWQNTQLAAMQGSRPASDEDGATIDSKLVDADDYQPPAKES
jgi:hypothetical protein